MSPKPCFPRAGTVFFQSGRQWELQIDLDGACFFYLFLSLKQAPPRPISRNLVDYVDSRLGHKPCWGQLWKNTAREQAPFLTYSDFLVLRCVFVQKLIPKLTWMGLKNKPQPMQFRDSPLKNKPQPLHFRYFLDRHVGKASF